MFPKKGSGSPTVHVQSSSEKQMGKNFLFEIEAKSFVTLLTVCDVRCCAALLKIYIFSIW